MGIFANIQKRKEFAKKLDETKQSLTAINKELQKIRNVAWYYEDIKLRKFLHEVSIVDVKKASANCIDYMNKYAIRYTELTKIYSTNPKLYSKFVPAIDQLNVKFFTTGKSIEEMLKQVQNIDIYEESKDLPKIEILLTTLKIKINSLFTNKTKDEEMEEEKPHQL